MTERIHILHYNTRIGGYTSFTGTEIDREAIPPPLGQTHLLQRESERKVTPPALGQTLTNLATLSF